MRLKGRRAGSSGVKIIFPLVCACFDSVVVFQFSRLRRLSAYVRSVLRHFSDTLVYLILHYTYSCDTKMYAIQLDAVLV